jgi:hypothetical protein
MPHSQWYFDLAFELEMTVQTTELNGGLVAKAHTSNGGRYWRYGVPGNAKAFFIRDGKFGMDIAWVGYFRCENFISDGQPHDLKVRYKGSEGNFYQLFVDDMQTPCNTGLTKYADPANDDTTIYFGTNIGSGGGTSATVTPPLVGELYGISYHYLEGAHEVVKQHPPPPSTPEDDFQRILRDIARRVRSGRWW